MKQIQKEEVGLEETINGLNETLMFSNISHENPISQQEWKEQLMAEKEKVKILKNKLYNLHCSYISVEEKNNEVSFNPFACFVCILCF